MSTWWAQDYSSGHLRCLKSTKFKQPSHFWITWSFAQIYRLSVEIRYLYFGQKFAFHRGLCYKYGDKLIREIIGSPAMTKAYHPIGFRWAAHYHEPHAIRTCCRKEFVRCRHQPCTGVCRGSLKEPSTAEW